MIPDGESGAATGNRYGVYGEALGTGLAGNFQGDVAISEALILKSPNGNSWKITVNDNGELMTEAVSNSGGESGNAPTSPDGEGRYVIHTADVPNMQGYQ